MTDSGTAAIVTGAASGIGRALVNRLSDSFDVVACLDVAEAVHEVADGADGAIGYRTDVSDHEEVRSVVDAVEERAETTAVVNNAAVSRYQWIGDLEPDEWQRILDVNLTGQYNVVHAVATRMYERERGTIVNVSSGAGKFGSASAGVHYSASKAGVFGLTRGLAKQLAPHVTVNCVVPGLIDTPLATDSDLWTEEELRSYVEDLPLERLGDPDEVARVIEFLCSDGASYMTGSIVDVDGGAALV
ncbi:SDR family oxidoreductase (plasmid) [Halorussus salilacus]|uniref:SDR family NAD(P)-dependent oxidoreductase n=1 Tax=Halorussus salilacus TaxID=2953750 RepID=UPI00209EC641|nr:SDR family NAD(P)-dependent oxidoreductase [Halorussus salilacus]USZ70175.1 SDR family oxidoreductase [Halorussus salilacus]